MLQRYKARAAVLRSIQGDEFHRGIFQHCHGSIFLEFDDLISAKTA
jgi:hypothetical protein